uniref:Endonuclease/exonuclease/phosphatase domain-containing protein n=1 Tax=Chromera velia CCMP2878 TaxID=1169474 RepID=A0A0G4GHQ1_9ALVE|eukprot:Cvel_21948.t1-p1 / transcript=Cvel_21948.t1 / gene=Cvel_21948 / organism=Chromera_velia_CCMP2878 / gene_product=hypothetical protein / transcript_product=hypothetical protein / location=Cvel_scaffold2107:11082-12245(-) / protein_length=388 / sequence_SO=supercontig / SO=protein_coding / is_pseudo=false
MSRAVTPFVWKSGEVGEWIPASGNGDVPECFKPPSTHFVEKGGTGDCHGVTESGTFVFRAATLNVLTDQFPWPVRLAIASSVRFPAALQWIEKVSPTFLGLNEVSPLFMEMLGSSEYIQKNYFLSDAPGHPNKTIKDANHHGCVLLSKLPFESCHAVFPPSGSDREAIAGVFTLPLSEGAAAESTPSRVVICSQHTISQQTEAKKKHRAVQVKGLVDFCTTLNAELGFLIMGDLNLHYIHEDAIVLDNNLLDCWAETHFGREGDGDEGKSFDSASNRMIPRYIPGEKRRMRLDRILLSQGCSLFPKTPCEFWAHEPVDVKRNIFVSDHYGLKFDLEAKGGEAFEGSPEVKEVLKRNAETEEVYEFSSTAFAAALIPHSGWLFLRACGY